MLLYKFYFDGTEVENPVAWENMVTTIKRDRELKGAFITFDVTLTFRSTGQAFLWNVLQNESWCRSVDVQILESRDAGSNYRVFYDGVIKISDVEFMGRQVNLENTIVVEQYAKCKVLDNSFFSRLHDNRTIKTNLFAGKSKNSSDITACPIQALSLFDPTTGTALALTQLYGCVRLDDALRYVTLFATDDRIEYESTLFGAGGEFSDVVLTYGIPIREEGAGNSMTQADFIKYFPQLDFQTVFSEANKKCNLGIYIDNTGIKPKLRVERYQDLFKDKAITRISNIDAITTRIKLEEIFSKLIIGSNNVLDQSSLSFPEFVPWAGMNKEEYPLVGDCNVGSELDLTCDFISSSNIIEQIAVNDPTDKTYDKNIFIIDCDESAPGLFVAKQSNWITTGPPYFYNERFTNSNVANRYLGAIPNNIFSLLGPSVNSDFHASLLPNNDAPHVTQVGTDFLKDPCIFNNDTAPGNFNPSGSYSTGTNRFTAPTTGVYSISVGIKSLIRMNVLYIGINFTATWHVRLRINKYSSLNVLIGVYDVINRNDSEISNFFGGLGFIWWNISRDYLGSVGINMNATDYLEVEYRISNLYPGSDTFTNPDTYDIWILRDSYFAHLANEFSGGVFTTYNPDDYPIIVDSFEQEMSKEQFDLILAEPLSLIEYSQGAQSYKHGWIDELKYDHFKGMASMRLLTTRGGQPEIDVQPPEIRLVTFVGKLTDIPFTLSVQDYYGQPMTWTSITNRCFFYAPNQSITIGMNAAHMGCPAFGAPSIYVVEGSPTGTNFYLSNTESITLFIKPGCNYIVEFIYDLTTVGNTFPQVTPEIDPPTNPGDICTLNIRCVSPPSGADYTFLWSTGEATQSINVTVPGPYWCDVTNVNPGTYDTNTIRFNFISPISETGQ